MAAAMPGNDAAASLKTENQISRVEHPQRFLDGCATGADKAGHRPFGQHQPLGKPIRFQVTG